MPRPTPARRRPSRPRRTAALFALGAALCGADCGDTLVRAIDEGSPGSSAGGPGGLCDGGGAPVALPGGACAADLGRQIFRFALCSCTTGTVSGQLRTDAFSSRAPSGAGASASLAANESWSLNSRTSIGGSLAAAGAGAPPALRLRGDGSVAGDVRAGGDFNANGIFQIGGDLFVDGNVTIEAGTLAALGRVHIAPGRDASGVTAGGGLVTEAVEVPPPCACDRLDVAAAVAPFAASNDNAAAGVTPASLDRPAAPLALPCGRYYFDRVAGDISLALTGRTAIFVGDSLTIDGGFRVDLGPDAELDLFVAGNVTLTGSAAFGSPPSPARVRVYAGGPVFNVASGAPLGANIYAPRADVAASIDVEMYGALHARRLAFSGDLTLHYDEAVLDAPGCQTP
jgi:hypothetical protein